MSLSNLIRSMGFLAIAWTVFALGLGALEEWRPSPPATEFFLPRPALHQVVTVGEPSWRAREEIRLVDQVTGKSGPIPLPSEDVWALLTVSPWRDRDGNLEVIGRWARHLDPPGERPFSGLGRFRLPDATVISRIPIDIIPTGRPCALPGRAGEILFPSGDGQLYRCNISEDSASDSRSNSHDDEADDFVPESVRRVKWHCARPSAGQIYMSEPYLSSEPSLRSYVFVSMSTQTQFDKKVQQKLPKLWWLRMNDRYDEIEAAGQLIGQVDNHKEKEIDPVAERFPTIAADSERKLSLIYITRKTPARLWQLRFARVESAPKAGEPRVTLSEHSGVALAEDIAADYPLFSADAKRAFARSASGQLITVTLPVNR